MFTAEQIKRIKTLNTSFSTEYIHQKAKEWDEFVCRIKNSGKDLSRIKLVPEEKDDEQ